MNRIADATRLCVGLMAHDPSNPFRQGYGLGSALITAQEQFDLNSHEVAAVADRLVEPLVKAASDVARTGASVSGFGWTLSNVLERFGVAR